MIIIDATNMILGRLASFAARNALLGENIEIINCGRAVISGNKDRTLSDYKEKLHNGSKSKGPFTYRRPEMFVKRVIRGMIPYRKENGKRAMKKIKCYIGVPDHLKDKKAQSIENANLSKLSVMKYTTVNEICRSIGGKI